MGGCFWELETLNLKLEEPVTVLLAHRGLAAVTAPDLAVLADPLGEGALETYVLPFLLAHQPFVAVDLGQFGLKFGIG